MKLAESDGCFNQAFQKGKGIGLQFHLESSKDSIDRLIYYCSDELKEGENTYKKKTKYVPKWGTFQRLID